LPRILAFQAVVNWANANGGVNGHHINLVIQQDSDQPTQNLAAAQSLVQNKGAMVIVEESDQMAGAAAWLSQNNIPVIAPGSFSIAITQYHDFFSPLGGYNPDPTLWNTNVVSFLKSIGAKKVGGLGLSNPTPAAEITDTGAAARLVGLKKGYLNTTVTTGTTDWTPYVLGFQSTGTDAVEMHLALTDVVNFIAAEQQQGLKLKILSPGLFNPSLLTGPSASIIQGAYVWSAYNPDPNSVPIKRMTAILSQYGDAANANPAGSNEANAYADALLLLEALKVGGINPTGPAIIKNLSHVTNWPSGGMFGKVNFTLEHSNQAPTFLGRCLWFLQIRGTQFVPLLKGKPVCHPTVRLHF
jgi:branched-chain amino acid transport system substrate-binding protein